MNKLTVVIVEKNPRCPKFLRYLRSKFLRRKDTIVVCILYYILISRVVLVVSRSRRMWNRVLIRSR